MRERRNDDVASKCGVGLEVTGSETGPDTAVTVLHTVLPGPSRLAGPGGACCQWHGGYLLPLWFMILWFVLFTILLGKARKFQPLMEGGRRFLVASLMSCHRFPSHGGADGWSQDPSPRLRKWMQLPCAGSSASLAIKFRGIKLVLWGQTPQQVGSAEVNSERRTSPPFNQESSNNWPGSLSTRTQSLTLG